MVSKHITRDYSAHRKNTIRPYDEYVGLEIFSYDHPYTKYYLAENNQFTGSNYTKRNLKAWTTYVSSDKKQDMHLKFTYNAVENAEYRFDILYEKSSIIWNDKKYDTGKSLTGDFIINNQSKDVLNKTLVFDGENNILKRIPVFVTLAKGVHTIDFEVPPNCYFLGVVVHKIRRYYANNYYGSNSGKDKGNLVLTKADLSISDMTKASELTLTVFYDDALECNTSPSGFYINYHDEVNFTIKNDEGNTERVFGGYISSILPNANRTELSIHCADRLVDGENKYILDNIKIQNGTTSNEDNQYTTDMTHYVSNHAHLLKYLCDVHEITLKSNITQNYLVEGEKQSKAFTISYGKNKSVKKIPVSNGKSTVHNNFITLRNNSSGDKKQTWTLYDAKQHSKKPIDITNKGYMSLTYGIGATKTSKEVSNSSTVDSSDTTVGVQKFTKCGVSQDKKYVVFIGKASVNETYKKYGNKIVKRIWENKCPNCGKATLRYDDGSKNGCITNHGHHGNKKSVPEGEITCTSCDCDFDGVGGKEKITGSKKRLKSVSGVTNSSQKEKDQLIKGKFKAVPKTGVEVSSDDIFQTITNEAFKYKYKRGATGQTYSQMKKTGHGDCWGFSDLIFTMLKKYDVTCKIVKYGTQYSEEHRSVLYKDANNKWVDFPYKKYGWDKKYNNMLNATSKSKTASKYKSHTGYNIGSVKVTSKKTTKKQTTKTTVTKGYDKDKPFQGYLKLVYSHNNSFNSAKKSLFLKFTLSTSSGDGIMNKGFPLYWINNSTRKSVLIGADDKPINIVDFIHHIHNNTSPVYLHSIQMIAPVKTPSKKSDGSTNEDTDWYKYDNSTHDESSCKLDLYQILFNNDANMVNSEEVASCGKSVSSLLKQIVDDTGYHVNMTFGRHRNEDYINFRVNNESKIMFTASEGDDNNILGWNSISYSPINSMLNNSLVVYKKDDTKYHYVHSRSPISVLEYGEQSTLLTKNEIMGDAEAYYYARMNDKFNSEQVYTYTITVPNHPNIRLGELVQITANANKLNTVKEVQSIKISFNMSDMPRVKTELGLGELSPDLQLRENIRKLRREAKKETTSFTGTASAINDENIYQWG